MGQFPNWLFQNMYSPGLEPEDSFNTSSVNVQETPLDIEKALKPYQQDTSNFSQIESDMATLRNKISGVDENIKNLSKSIDYDPIEKAREDYRGMYKWKGASKKRKLGSIGLGILDALLTVDSGRGLRVRREDEELKRYELMKDRVDKQISNERGRETSLNNLFGKLSSEYEKARINKEKNELLFKAKQEANKIQDTKVRNQFIVEVSKAASQGALNDAKIEEIKNNLNRPKNLADFSGLLSQGKLPEESFNILKELLSASRPTNFRQQLYRGPIQDRAVYNPETKEIDFIKTQPLKNYNPITGQLSEDIEELPGRYIPAAEVRSLNEMRQADSLFRSAGANALADLASGKIKDYTGLNNTSLGQQIKAFINNIPDIATASAFGWQVPSFAALMHVKSIYGGRAPESLINDLKIIVEGRASSPEQYAAALLTQGILTRSNLLEKVQPELIAEVKGDSNFYNFVKAKMNVLMQVAKNAKRAPKLPYLEDIIQEYKSYKNKQPTETSPRSANRPNVQKLIDDAARKLNAQ